MPPARSPRGSRTRGDSTSRGPSATAATSDGSANAPLSLSVSRIATGRPPASATIHGAEVDAADVGRVVVQQADEAEVRLEVRDELLGPLAAQPAGEVAVARVQVPADADRPAVVEPGVAAGPRPAHQEVALAVAQDEVRDHLLERRVDLHRGPRLEPAFGVDRGEERLDAVRPDAGPAGAGDDRRARHDEDLLAARRRGHSTASASCASEQVAGLREPRLDPLRVRSVRAVQVDQPRVEHRPQVAQPGGDRRTRSWRRSRCPSRRRHGQAGWHPPTRSRQGRRSGSSPASERRPRRPRPPRRAPPRPRAAGG